MSTPVLMHIALRLSVCLSVTGPKFRLDNNSYLRKYRQDGQSGGEYLLGASLQVRSLRVIGRCAHFNINLLHFFFFFLPCSSIMFGNVSIIFSPLMPICLGLILSHASGGDFSNYTPEQHSGPPVWPSVASLVSRDRASNLKPTRLSNTMVMGSLWSGNTRLRHFH